MIELSQTQTHTNTDKKTRVTKRTGESNILVKKATEKKTNKKKGSTDKKTWPTYKRTEAM